MSRDDESTTMPHPHMWRCTQIRVDAPRRMSTLGSPSPEKDHLSRNFKEEDDMCEQQLLKRTKICGST